MSTLFRNTTIAGTSTCLASNTCSRVCGIGPSGAATTRIAPSICAAPVIVFDVVRMSRAVHVGIVTILGLVLDVRNRNRDAACLFLRRIVDAVERPEARTTLQRQRPRIAAVEVVFPWSMTNCVLLRLRCGFVPAQNVFLAM